MNNFDNLSKSEIIQLIGKYSTGWNVSYVNYDRMKIVETIEKNPFIGSILNKIARAVSNIGTMVGNEVENTFKEAKGSELDIVLNKPNPFLSLKELKRNAAYNYFAFGENFTYFDRLEMGGNNNGKIIPGTIFLAPPDITDIKTDRFLPTEYVINGDFTKTIKLDNIIHQKSYNPRYDNLHGLSPIMVAGIIVDKIIAANDTETKTFQNSGPAYLISAKEGDSYSDEQHLNLMQRLKRAWRKLENKRGIVGSSAVLDVNQLGANPADMGTMESQKLALRILLVIWGLDPGLFDIEASTYNNKMMMEKAVYTECAIPFMEDFCEKFNDKFEAIYKMKVITDTSQIEALQPNIKEKVAWMKEADVFTDNEIREAIGYTKRESESSDLTPSEKLTTESTQGFNPNNLNNPIV